MRGRRFLDPVDRLPRFAGGGAAGPRRLCAQAPDRRPGRSDHGHRPGGESEPASRELRGDSDRDGRGHYSWWAARTSRSCRASWPPGSNAAIFREDITGPVVTVSSYAREDDLAGVLNQHALAPRTRIWIGDHARGLSLARRLRGPSVLVGPPASGDVPGYAHSSEPMPSRRLLLCSSDS